MEKLLELGSHYASDFIKKGENYIDRPKFSLDLILDERLGAARLAELTPTEVMFGKYWYSSRINEGMVSQLKDIVDEVSSRVKHEVGDVWLDIAANDGTLLKMVPNSFTKVGIDPADDTFLAESSKVATMVQDFFSVDAYNRSGFGNKKPKVITTIAMFYDLEDPDSFIKDIVEILDDNGVWVIQMSYTPLMIKQLAFDNSCGEHVYYYSLNSIKKLIEPHSLKIVDCSINHTNGGSFRVSMQKICADPNSFANQPVRDCCDVRVESLLNWERTCCDISDPDLWYQFQRDIDSLRETVVSFIKAAKADGKTVAGIGACHDSYTRVVTEDGIKSFKDITKNDLIYSLNPDNGEMELSPIEDIMIYQYSGEMIRFEGQRVNQMVTPNHNIMFSSRSGVLKFENAEKFSKRYETKLPFPKWLNGRDDEYFDIREFVDQDLYSRKNTIIPNQFKTADFLYLLGIFIGDGYCSTQGNGWSINLCIPEKDKARKRLQETLERMGLSYRSYSNEIQVASKALYEICLHCGSGALHKRIPKWSLNYSSSYLKYLLDGLIDSDGWYEANRMRFCSSSSLLIKDFVELCFKTGFYPSVSKRKVVKNPKIKEREIISKTGYIVNINKTIPNFKRSKIVNYDGEVWCLSVKNKNFLVERDGKFAFSGNSTKGNTLLQYFGLDSTLIDFISERSPAKHGLYTIGTNIPIVSEEEARQRKPDYMLLLPWHFVSEITAREDDYLSNGGKLIIPCPKFTIISK